MKKQRTFPVYFNFKKPHYNLRSQNRVAAERPNILADNRPIVPQANIYNMAHAVTVRSQPAKFSGLPSENAQGWLDQFEAYCALNEIDDRNLINEFNCGTMPKLVLFITSRSQRYICSLASTFFK